MQSIFKTFIMLSLIAGLSQTALAQVTLIKGLLRDSQGKPVAAHLTVRDTSGLIIAEKSISDRIEIDNIRQNIVKLTLSAIRFRDTTFNLRYTNAAVIDLGTIVLVEKHIELRAVNIAAPAAAIRYGSNGSMEVNVAGTLLASSSSVTELLSRSPGITINEGIISLQGKGEAIIYLNGVVIPMERLSGISVSQIIKIELLANPPARYEAAGRAIINITTKSSTGNGLSGKVAQYASYSPFAGLSANTFTDLEFGNDKLSVTANIALLKGSGREFLYTTRLRSNPEDYLRSVLTTDWKRDFKLFNTYGISSRYAFNPSVSLALSLNGNRDLLGGTVTSTNQINNSSGTNFYGSNSERDELRLNNTATLDLNYKTDTLGSSLYISSQYAKYNTDYNDGITEYGSSAPRSIRNIFKQDLQINSFQADRQKLFNKDQKIEFGIRYNNVTNTSSNRFLIYTPTQESFQTDNALSSIFAYQENIWAAYTSWYAKAGSLNFNLGSRAELTQYSLETTAGDGRKFSKKYINIFPALQAELPLGTHKKLRASYASRIIRPRYQALNPFVIYQDPFSTIEGNPNLVPERAQALELAAQIGMTELKIAYTYTTNQLSGAALRGNTPESYVLKSINIAREKALLLSLTQQLTYGTWLQSVNTASFSYAKSFDNVYDFSIGASRPQIYLYSNNTFSLNYGIKFQLLAWYLGEKYTGLRHDEKRFNVTVGLEKLLLTDKLKITVVGNDFFNYSGTAGDYTVGKTTIYYNRRYSNNYYRITASFRFGVTNRPLMQNTRNIQIENSRAN